MNAGIGYPLYFVVRTLNGCGPRAARGAPYSTTTVAFMFGWMTQW